MWTTLNRDTSLDWTAPLYTASWNGWSRLDFRSQGITFSLFFFQQMWLIKLMTQLGTLDIARILVGCISCDSLKVPKKLIAISCTLCCSEGYYWNISNQQKAFVFLFHFAIFPKELKNKMYKLVFSFVLIKNFEKIASLTIGSSFYWSALKNE